MIAIDRLFDIVDRGVDHVDHVLNCGKQPAEKNCVRRARGTEVRVVEVVSKVRTQKPNTTKLGNGTPSLPAVATKTHGGTHALPAVTAKLCSGAPALPLATRLTRRPRFYIVEAVASASASASVTPQFIVTDGGNARTVCATRAFAEQILQALEKA